MEPINWPLAILSPFPGPAFALPAGRSDLFTVVHSNAARAEAHASARSSRFARTAPYDDAGDERAGLIDSEPAHIVLDTQLPPNGASHLALVDIAEQVEDVLAGTHAKVRARDSYTLHPTSRGFSALDKLHAKHVLPGFTDRSSEEREIEAATTDITKDFRQCQSLIQRIASAHAFPPSSADSRNEALAAKNVQRGLAAKVQDLSAAFRKKQRVYMEKLQGHAIRNQDLLVASGVTSLKGSEGLSAVDDDVEAASRTGQFASQQLLEPDLDLRARDRELSEIAKSIGTLAELFKDLSALVIDQGTLLDSVEYNIEQTAAHVTEAAKELDIATRYVNLLTLPVELRREHMTPHASLRYRSAWEISHSFCALCARQVPKEHGSAKVYLPPPSDHLRPRRRPHLQTAPTRFLPFPSGFLPTAFFFPAILSRTSRIAALASSPALDPR
ncbi:hypothetical protein EW146_g2293 [Bondarzewia mesenterica]|uniref:t-SNARE coiled-coil homology domain-containing protein n=1 Tax=Bondarzewia mesenterica TaxID=1095465 RepID=A0A4S4M1B9_9AGAM|nr:hypothetical protein EW146_g2293 [Bondarzewia mesenterica]